MKHCPTCNRSFVDESLAYCTDDGTVLVAETGPESADAQETRMFSDPPPTAFMSAPPQTNDLLASESLQQSVPSPNEHAAPEPYRWASEAPPVWTPPPAPAYPIRQQSQQTVAILSLVFGIAGIPFGWFFGGLIFCFLAVVLGFVPLTQIKSNPLRYGGKPMAIGGMVTGGIVLLIHLALLAFWIIMLAIGSLR